MPECFPWKGALRILRKKGSRKPERLEHFNLNSRLVFFFFCSDSDRYLIETMFSRGSNRLIMVVWANILPLVILMNPFFIWRSPSDVHGSALQSYKVCKITDHFCDFFQWLLHQTTVTIQGEEETTHWYKKWSSKVAKIIFLLQCTYQEKCSLNVFFSSWLKSSRCTSEAYSQSQGWSTWLQNWHQVQQYSTATVGTWYSSTVQTAAIDSKYCTVQGYSSSESIGSANRCRFLVSLSFL